jgi:hypothetical protein
MKFDSLFSPDPRIRWKHAKKYARERGHGLQKEIAERCADWPRYWWGVINAWLVFLGPSPGNSKSIRQIDWKTDRFPTLGKPHELFKREVDSTGFWERMRQWTVEAYKLAGIFCDNEEAALGSTLLANVLDTREGDATKITDEALLGAIPKVVTHLESVRPRIIIPMEKRTSRYMLEELRRRGTKIVVGPQETQVLAKNQGFPYYRPKTWHLRTSFGPLVIAESPQHPSKKNFYEPAIVDQYLASIIRMCL